MEAAGEDGTDAGGMATALATQDPDDVTAVIDRIRRGARLRPSDSLRGANLMNQDLSGLNLAGVDLRGADLSRTNLTKANLVGARLEGAVLFGATLDHAELLKADLRGAGMTQCSARNAGFGGAVLENATLFNATLKGASFTHSNLKAADFRAANLTGARLRDCCMRDADFSRSVLRGSDLKESDTTGASFHDAELQGSKLNGLRGASQANWIGADILNVDFCGAYLVRRQILDQNYLHEFRSQGRMAEVLYRIWWATSDCGRSFTRWSLWTAALAILFAALYPLVEIDLGGRPDNWMTTIYFSVVTLTTLGYGDIVPTSVAARLVVLVEVVAGYMMLGGLLGIFANKMGRRAD